MTAARKGAERTKPEKHGKQTSKSARKTHPASKDEASGTQAKAKAVAEKTNGKTEQQTKPSTRAKKGNGKLPKSYAEPRPGDPPVGSTVMVTGGYSKGKSGVIQRYGLFKGAWFHARVQFAEGEVRSVSLKNLQLAGASPRPAAGKKVSKKASKKATAQAETTTPQS